MIVHGFYHLMGYDHMVDEEKVVEIKPAIRFNEKPVDNSGVPIVPLHLRFRFLFHAQVPNRNIPSNHHLSVYINDSESQKG